MNLYLYQFNNYFNRTIKKYDSIEDYGTYQIGSALNNINFIIGDGISTEQVINWNDALPNYLIAEDTDGTFTRWFVIESERTRKGQFKLSLRRDVIADNMSDVVNAPCFIEKATLDDDDPLIFNDEGMKVNQVLTNQTRLTDETQVPWIVAYIPRHGQTIEDDPTEHGWESTPVHAAASNPNYNIAFASREALENTFNQKILSYYDVEMYFAYLGIQNSGMIKQFHYERGTLSSNQIRTYYDLPNRFNEGYDLNVNSTIKSSIKSQYGLIDENEVMDYMSYNGKIALVGGTTLYKINVSIGGETSTSFVDQTNTSLLYTNVKTALGNPTTTGDTNHIIKSRYSYKQLILTLEPIQDSSATFQIATNRRTLKDQPYDMICFPYIDKNFPSIKALIKVNNQTINYDEIAMLNIATNMPTTWGSSVVYDVQILPYCPVRDLIAVDGSINLTSAEQGSKYTLITGANDTTIGICFYCLESSGTFDIGFDIPYENGKVQIMTEMYRLVSPNYSSAYELKPFENGGIDYFNVDFTYLPYQPWIKINPNFKWLNGRDFNDSRGLILGGNYSITTLSNAWANYQLNNVNYEAIFNRQIKNMKTNFKYSQYESIASGVIGGIGQSVASGIATGNVGVGAAMGVANAVGMGADIALNNLKFKEAKSYAKDMYNYNLQNIQAMPETISKVTAFNYNSKYMPFVEYYTCTAEEKDAVEKKLKYNGMTVMRIGTIDEYIKDDETFIQGQIIRMDALQDDFHMAVEIADEVKRGIFIKRSDV